MMLKQMGVVRDYERVREYSVAIVGVGGVGVGVCEMLTRCGFGKVVIYDYDTIELANMNKMFYRPEQAGWNKTMAVRHYCSELCPDTAFEVHNMDVTLDANRAKLKDSLAHGGVDRKSPVNLILGCVDNFAARQVLEALSEELQVPFMDAVVADDAMSAHLQLIIPGRTGGLEAAPIKQQQDKRQGACAASLPTTDSILAGLMAQNVLKFLLGFGEVNFLLSYNAVNGTMDNRCGRSPCCPRAPAPAPPVHARARARAWLSAAAHAPPRPPRRAA